MLPVNHLLSFLQTLPWPTPMSFTNASPDPPPMSFLPTLPMTQPPPCWKTSPGSLSSPVPASLDSLYTLTWTPPRVVLVISISRGGTGFNKRCSAPKNMLINIFCALAPNSDVAYSCRKSEVKRNSVHNFGPKWRSLINYSAFLSRC